MRIDKWESCAFNNQGMEKYARLSLELKHGDCELMTEERMQELTTIAVNEGINNLHCYLSATIMNYCAGSGS